jgi:ankyrin repeat protein
MKALRTNIRLIPLVLLLSASYLGPTAYAQQPAPAPTAEQEFLDSIRKGNAARVSELLKQNPALIKATTKNGTTAVLLALITGHDEIAESLVATGIELNIFEAAAVGRLDRVQELLNKSPELIKAYSPDGWTALHLSLDHLDVVDLLLDRGADVNAVTKNAFSATPLQGAAMFQTIDLAKVLIKHGANVNCRAAAGVTPLHEVSKNGQIEFAKLLLDNGANINAKDDKGKTPLTIALENKQTEMATFLRSRNATQ